MSPAVVRACMGIGGLHHIVLRFEDVPAAESFYCELFGLDVLFREGYRDGESGVVPTDVSWAEARDAGITPTMAFLDRDAFTLAVAVWGEAGDESAADGGRPDHVALAVDEATFEAVTERAERLDCPVERNAAHHRTLVDRFGVEWELNASSPPPTAAFEPFDL